MFPLSCLKVNYCYCIMLYHVVQFNAAKLGNQFHRKRALKFAPRDSIEHSPECRKISEYKVT